jgi:hypothetical protein
VKRARLRWGFPLNLARFPSLFKFSDFQRFSSFLALFALFALFGPIFPRLSWDFLPFSSFFDLALTAKPRINRVERNEAPKDPVITAF